MNDADENSEMSMNASKIFSCSVEAPTLALLAPLTVDLMPHTAVDCALVEFACPKRDHNT